MASVGGLYVLLLVAAFFLGLVGLPSSSSLDDDDNNYRAKENNSEYYYCDLKLIIRPSLSQNK